MLYCLHLTIKELNLLWLGNHVYGIVKVITHCCCIAELLNRTLTDSDTAALLPLQRKSKSVSVWSLRSFTGSYSGRMSNRYVLNILLDKMPSVGFYLKDVAWKRFLLWAICETVQHQYQYQNIDICSTVSAKQIWWHKLIFCVLI